MNTVEITDLLARSAHDDELTTLEDLSAPQQCVSRDRQPAQKRYALLLVILLSSGWLCYSVLSSLDEINAECDVIRQTMYLPTR